MKWLLCISSVFLIYTLEMCVSDKPASGPCNCGVFEKLTISNEDKALIQQTAMNVTCNQEGNEVCQKMCKALAEIARAKGPTLLCASVLNVNDLNVFVFARSCFDKTWTYVNLTNTKPICCQNGEPIDCQNETEH